MFGRRNQPDPKPTTPEPTDPPDPTEGNVAADPDQTARSTEGGQVVQFPSRDTAPSDRTADQATGQSPDHAADRVSDQEQDQSTDLVPVIRGEIVNAPPTGSDADPGARTGEVVLVDPPVADRGDWLVDLRSRLDQRRAVLPGWLRSVQEFKEVAGWVATYLGHILAFYAVRSPLYAAKLAGRSPRGLFRSMRAVSRWWFDLDSEAVRLSAVTPKPDPEMYLRLAKHRDARVRGRTVLVILAAIVAVVGAAAAVALIRINDIAVPGWSGWAALVVAVIVFGLGGGRADRPLINRAVVASKVERLTSDIVIRALGSLGLAEINKALAKGGSGITFPSPITRDGPGWRAEVDLPFGVTVSDIIERRDRLASGLRRALGCVWPEPAPDSHAGRLILWVGDQDMSKARPSSFPLARSGVADLFKPLPFGTDQRGRAVDLLLMFANLLIGAMPRQGKTFALRVVLLACALDVRAQLRVFELKGTGDLSPLEKVAHHYASGADDETLRQAVASLREVRAELDRRAKVISGLPKDICPENKVTPELAGRRSLGLFPLVIAIDECQELFSHPTYGSEAEELCLPIIKRGPALGIMLILATQRPDKDSLPTGISANMSLRFCLRVMGQLENDMVLGTSAYRNGIRATMFTQKDKGIGFLVGNADDAQIVRSHYTDGPASDKIADRARALRAKAGTLSGHAIGDGPEQTGPRHDLLDDLNAVFAATEEKAWSETLCARLAELRPDAYGNWSPEQLTVALKPYGVKTGQVWGTVPDGQPDAGKGANRRGITRDALTKAVTERDRNRGDDRP